MRTLTSLAARLILLALMLCAGVAPVQAQVGFRAAASATAAGVLPAFRAAASATTTGATLTITKPAGVVANDVLVASVGVTPSSATITPPAGWTLVRRIDNADATSNSLAVFYKAAGGSEPASYDWSVSGVAFAVGGIQAFSGVDATNPIDIENGQSTPSATGHATPSVTTPVANAMVVTSHTFASSRTWSAPSGMSESYDRPSGANNATGQSIAGARVLQAVAGASGVKTANAAGNADAGNAHVLALRPASVNLAIATPAGTVANDVMIAAIGLNHASAVITPPAGWTLVRRVDNASAPSNSLAVYRRTVAAGEAPSHTWAIAGGEFLVGGIQGFSGADTANPLDIENGQSTPSGTTHSTPSVTTTVTNAMLVTAHTYASSRTWTPGAGLTEGYDQPSGANSATGQSIAGNYQLQAVAGASGAKAATAAGNADDGNTHILALRPNGGAPSAGLYFIHTDHLNTPRLIANNVGQTVWKWETTDPFANNTPNENPSGLGTFTCNLRLPGQYFDKETNLHYNYHRWYDPALGRYLQSDPIGLYGGINTYLYVDANPLGKTDPTGLIPPGADPECFRRGECKCATPECAAGLRPTRPTTPAQCFAACMAGKTVAGVAIGLGAAGIATRIGGLTAAVVRGAQGTEGQLVSLSMTAAACSEICKYPLSSCPPTNLSDIQAP